MSGLTHPNEIKPYHYGLLVKDVKFPQEAHWDLVNFPEMQRLVGMVSPAQYMVLEAISQILDEPIDPASIDPDDLRRESGNYPPIPSETAGNTIDLIRDMDPIKFTLTSDKIYKEIIRKIRSRPDSNEMKDRCQFDEEDADAIMQVLDPDNKNGGFTQKSLNEKLCSVTTRLYLAFADGKLDHLLQTDHPDTDLLAARGLGPAWQEIQRLIRERIYSNYQRELKIDRKRQNARETEQSLDQNWAKSAADLNRTSQELFQTLDVEVLDQRRKLAENLAFLAAFYVSEDASLQTFPGRVYRQALSILDEDQLKQYLSRAENKDVVLDDRPIEKDRYFGLLCYLAEISAPDNEALLSRSDPAYGIQKYLDEVVWVMMDQSSEDTMALFDKARRNFNGKVQAGVMRRLWPGSDEPDTAHGGIHPRLLANLAYDLGVGKQPAESNQSLPIEGSPADRPESAPLATNADRSAVSTDIPAETRSGEVPAISEIENLVSERSPGVFAFWQLVKSGTLQVTDLYGSPTTNSPDEYEAAMRSEYARIQEEMIEAENSQAALVFMEKVIGKVNPHFLDELKEKTKNDKNPTYAYRQAVEKSYLAVSFTFLNLEEREIRGVKRKLPDLQEIGVIIAGSLRAQWQQNHSLSLTDLAAAEADSYFISPKEKLAAIEDAAERVAAARKSSYSP